VPSAWNQQHLEIFVGFDQRVDNLQSRRWIDIRIKFANDQQQLATQPMSICNVRLLFVMRSDGPPKPEHFGISGLTVMSHQREFSFGAAVSSAEAF